LGSGGLLEPDLSLRAQKMSIVQKLRDAQKGKLASEQLTDSGLRDVKDFLQLPWSEFLLSDELQNVLMQVSLQLQFKAVLFVQIKFIQNASPRPMRDHAFTSILRVAPGGAA